MDTFNNLFFRHEAMADLIYMMNTLVDNKGNILIPGIMDDVAPVTDEESATYDSIDFDLDHFKNDIGCQKLMHHNDKVYNFFSNVKLKD